jgi:hypothetical protein
MTSRFKVLMVCLGAFVALSVAGVGVAQAARPAQPRFITNSGETLQSNLSIEDSSQRSRLWSVSLGAVVRCEKDESEGTIGPKGLDNEQVVYRECKLFSIVENSDKQHEEGEEIPGCEVGSPAGVIATAPIKSHLVWAKGENKMRDLFEPVTGTVFTKILIKKVGALACPTGAEVSLPVEGSVLGQIWRWRTGAAFEEATMGYLTFDVKNEGGEVRQLDREWEVKQENGEEKSGTAELEFDGKHSGLESIEQIEIQKPGKTRKLWGVTE